MKFTKVRPQWLAPAVATLSALLVVGCGGGSDSVVADATPQLTPAQQCAALQGSAVPASAIGLPTTGATISSATLISATASGNTNGEFCKVLGGIHPVDAAAPDIKFEVDLPSTWNGKSVHFGGGGLDGSVPDTTGFTNTGLTLYGEPKGVLTPLARGYVTLASDSGHEGSFGDGRFAQNDEALANYAGDHIKKTHDVALFLTKQRYGATFAHSYYIGGSGGGRQALIAAQKYASDYDGIISTFPASGIMGLAFQMGRISQASLAPGGFINANKAAVLKKAVMSACDSLDGATDGLISNPGLCTFDPATLRCPGGTDTGDTCLSDAQISTVNTMATPLNTSFDFANGIHNIPKYNVLAGTDFWSGFLFPLGDSAADAVLDPATSAEGQWSFFYAFPNSLLRYAIARDPSLDLMSFNFTDPGALTARTQTVSQMMDSTTVNLDNFKNRGGKVILQHGLSDQYIPAQMSIDYYNRLLANYGQNALSSFLKFYLVPGAAHGFGGQFEGAYDGLTALDNWVTKGTAPQSLVITDLNPPTAGRTRPLCEYPQWPKYVSGDVNAATSYICSN
ncbi:tannase/feruloyl esterase family alpha/beta hydrolase [Ralstonia chuxiongensis]|uniref:Tannase/feruloyl esterase family alpha/beta hydrolase n=1 Tax=Ralstonia chuxiongensis TaxID=2957504 RepID=A0AA41WYV4_9RALS|nr:tannase/feruloyl esterase family alpha/beta hydrolase [Ralstonia chuxiongensis]MCP1174927.1 tannase/feruloyl esterase family alpha/beta hydrolase [Ralstonia chuxiongensis]